MLVGVSGTPKSGRHQVINYLTAKGFSLLCVSETKSENPLDFSSVTDLIDHATRNWRSDFVVLIESIDLLTAAKHRPFFVHISLDAPVSIRWARFNQSGHMSLEEFVDYSDKKYYDFYGAMMSRTANISLVNNFANIEDLNSALDGLDLRDQTRVRPSWDAYFMQLANLAAQRSNCMKRRVGCVVVRDKRVLSTGYNGTPRGIKNCNEGGCERCNQGFGAGAALSTCLCLHAEENALLEAGRDRVGINSSLYCNTCPCLTCSIKIIQSGIKEVIYSQSYSMDEQAAKIFKEAGVILRQYDLPHGFAQSSGWVIVHGNKQD